MSGLALLSILAAIVVVFLFVYLVFALLYAEEF